MVLRSETDNDKNNILDLKSNGLPNDYKFHSEGKFSKARKIT